MQHVHDLSRLSDPFCGHSDVSGRIQDLAQPEDKSQIPIDNKDVLHLNEPTGPLMQFTDHTRMIDPKIVKTR